MGGEGVNTFSLIARNFYSIPNKSRKYLKNLDSLERRKLNPDKTGMNPKRCIIFQEFIFYRRGISTNYLLIIFKLYYYYYYFINIFTWMQMGRKTG